MSSWRASGSPPRAPRAQHTPKSDPYSPAPRRRGGSTPNACLTVLREEQDSHVRHSSATTLDERDSPLPSSSLDNVPTPALSPQLKALPIQMVESPEPTTNTLPSEGSQNTFHASREELGHGWAARGQQRKTPSCSPYPHLYEIALPPQAYDGIPLHQSHDPHTATHGSMRTRDTPPPVAWRPPNYHEPPREDLSRLAGARYPEVEEADLERRLGDSRGMLHNVLALHAYDHGQELPIFGLSDPTAPIAPTRAERRGRIGSTVLGLDPEDPLLTGVKKKGNDDDEAQFLTRKAMTYKQRRKEDRRLKIVNNIVSERNRYGFIMKLAEALMFYGAPSHRLQSQLSSAARILNVDAEFICLPGFLMASFGDPTTHTSETRTLKVRGGLALGRLRDVHEVYRAVVYDQLSAFKGIERLDVLLAARSEYGRPVQLVLTFLVAALVCPLGFGGSFLDLLIAGLGAVAISTMKILTEQKSLYTNTFEICVAVAMSFVARGLSAIHSQLFCYNATSSAGIVAILPGYLILTASLELGTKNMVSGSVKLVWALVYTLFLGFGLQLGSDAFLAFDRPHAAALRELSGLARPALELIGSFMSDDPVEFKDFPAEGTFTYTNLSAPALLATQEWVSGCLRSPTAPWYVRPFPWWTAFLLVPAFAVCKSLALGQPWRDRDLPVMVVIAVCAYAANIGADYYIFGKSDVVSAIGAFVCGVLGNAYARSVRGTAFTYMVTGVLFLVPSGLSAAGGITAEPDVIDIGGAMIKVGIGITVGLFMAQALVYMFGERKRAGVFTF